MTDHLNMLRELHSNNNLYEESIPAAISRGYPIKEQNNLPSIILGSLIACLALFSGFQQIHIQNLENDISTIKADTRFSDLSNRMDNTDTQIDSIERNLQATDQKADLALNTVDEMKKKQPGLMDNLMKEAGASLATQAIGAIGL